MEKDYNKVYGRYDYVEAVRDSVNDWIDEHQDYIAEEADINDRDGVEQFLNDYLWAEDSVTGNGSGSYTFNSWKAEENLCHNHDLIQEVVTEFGVDLNNISAEALDVSIRCYLLGDAISDALDEVYDEIRKNNKAD